MILSGKKASEELFRSLLQKNLIKSPHLAIVQVGNNPASNTYIRLKKKKISELGFKSTHLKLEENISEQELIAKINELNSSEEITGIIIQLPLPDHFNKSFLLNQISPNKDVDCLTDDRLGKFFAGESSIMPATALGVIRMLEYYEIPLAGKSCTIVGRSNLVGKPLALGLLQKDMTVTICHSRSENLPFFTQNADLVVLATGKAKYFSAEHFRAGQTIIDVGISLDENGKLSGDVSFDSVSGIVSNITPVPGGVGPMTIYGLIENMITLASRDH